MVFSALMKTSKTKAFHDLKESYTKHNLINRNQEENSIKIYLNILLNIFIAVFCAAVIYPIFTWDRKFEIFTNSCSVTPLQKSALTYAIYTKSSSENHLVHVKDTFVHFGLKRVSLDEQWDVLWAHDYPFYLSPHYKNLKEHQLVNHFPGCGFITNKVHLSTTGLPFLPRSFKIPDDKNLLVEYLKLNPNLLFVEKHNEHRHIVIKKPDEFDLKSNNTFIQEYIQNPFLVDGYKFDIGVYVVVTSVDPLRVYMYTGETLFRYCSEKYYPFNSTNTNKYIVGDDYLPTWEIPSLKKYFKEYEGGMRNSFEAYLHEKSLDGNHIWATVENIITETLLLKERQISSILQKYNSKNFFELLRFDFILDKNLKVYLMEANMSPNLSSAHFLPNSILYEQLLYSVFHLIGIGSALQNFNSVNRPQNMMTKDKDLATFIDSCASNGCSTSCNALECWLCLPCLSEKQINILRTSHREHLQKIQMKRIFPIPIINKDSFNIYEATANLSEKNKWMSLWFYGKCLYDNSWCL